MKSWDDLIQGMEEADDEDFGVGDLSLDDLDDEDLEDEELDEAALEELQGLGLGAALFGTGGNAELDDDDEDEDADPSGDDLDRSVFVSCPYCGREVEHVVDPGGGTHQVYVEDCEVCCQPWEVSVHFQDGVAWATARALDE